jgi:hypothetical protein
VAIYGATALAAGALVLAFLPETAGRRMPDTLDECDQKPEKKKKKPQDVNEEEDALAMI